ncbi:unnamed protein product [Merluccius merluccius]
MHDYTNWTNPDLAAPAASHFPFGLDNPNKDHPQPQEMRGRERQGGGFRVGPEREYELGTLNEGWQRRWEPSCSSSSSLSDNSYRELQAWAARYSHSLPRRRRMGAEMKGAFQEAPEGSRTLGRVNRNAPDSNMAALQRTGSSSNTGDIVESIQTQVNPVPADDEPQPQPELEKGKPIDPMNEDTMKAEELQSDKASEALPCLPQITFPEKETLKARAERILGIPLFDSDNEQIPLEVPPPLKKKKKRTPFPLSYQVPLKTQRSPNILGPCGTQ